MSMHCPICKREYDWKGVAPVLGSSSYCVSCADIALDLLGRLVELLNGDGDVPALMECISDAFEKIPFVDEDVP